MFPAELSCQRLALAIAGMLSEPPTRTAGKPVLRSPARSSSSPPPPPERPVKPWLFHSPVRRAGGAASSPRGLVVLLILVLASGAAFSWLLSRGKAEVAAYVAMCLIVKDQPRDVVEWVQYHHALGVDKFYVFDHNSSVPLVKELHPLVDSGLVRYQYFRCGWLWFSSGDHKPHSNQSLLSTFGALMWQQTVIARIL